MVEIKNSMLVTPTILKCLVTTLLGQGDNPENKINWPN